MSKQIRTVLALLCAVCLLLGTAVSQAEALPGTSAASDKTTYVFTLGLGAKNDDNDMQVKWQASQHFVQSFLRTNVNPEKDSVMLAYIRNTPDIETAFDITGGVENVAQRMASHSYQPLKNDFDALESYAKRQLKAMPADGKTEIWLITSRDAMVVGKEGAEKHKVVVAFSELLANPDVSIHFVYMRMDTEAPVNVGETQMRMDDYLALVYPGQVTWQEISTSEATQTTLPESYLLSADEMLVPVTELPVAEKVDPNSERDWRFVYNHKPWDQTNDAMLLISSNLELRGGAESITMTRFEPAPVPTAVPEVTAAPEATVIPEATAEAAAPIKVSVVRHANAAYLYADDLPEGSYVVELHLNAKNGIEPRLTMQPYVVVPRNAESRKVTVAAQNQMDQWYRDDQTLTLTAPLGSANMPSIENWTAWAVINGTEVPCEILSSEVTDAMRWTVKLPGSALAVGQGEIQMQMRLQDKAGVMLTSDALPMTVSNRAPQIAASQQTEYDVFYDLLPFCESNANAPRIDITAFFTDDDSDALTYDITSCVLVTDAGNGAVQEEVVPTDNDASSVHINVGQLIYIPKAAAQAVKVNLIARDGNNDMSETVTLTFRHHSMQNLFANSFKFVPHNSESVQQAEGGAWKGTLGQANTLRFGLQDPSLLPLFKEAFRLCNIAGPELTSEIPYAILLNRHYGDTTSKQSDFMTVRVTMTDDDIGFDIPLSADAQPTEVGTRYVVDFRDENITLSNGHPVTDVLPVNTHEVNVDNSMPALVEGTQQKLALEDVAKDFLHEATPVDVGALLGAEGIVLKDWFTDENGLPLKYEVEVKGDAQDQVTLVQNGEQIAARADQPHVYDVDGEAPLTVALKGSGDYALTFYGRDSEYFATRDITVTLKSQTTNVLIVAAIAIAILAVIVALVLFIIWQQKPSFGNVHIGLCITDDETCAVVPEPVIPMRAHGKRAVPFTELAIASRQPVLDAQWLESISLAPTRHGVGDLKFSGKHADTNVVCGGATRPASGSIHLSDSERNVRIRTRGLCVIVTFTRR